MSAISHQAGESERPHHLLRSAVLIGTFWAIAAVCVAGLHRVTAGSPVEAVIAQSLAILAVSFFYMKFATDQGTIDHALLVGAAWLVLAIVTELVMSTSSHRLWFQMLGSPTSALRNVMLFAWILAPAIFASRRG